MDKLIHETEKVGKLPQSLIEQGYMPPAFVRVYQAGEGKYEIHPCIQFEFKDAESLMDKAITTLPLFEGTEAEAIAHGKRILEDVENWPEY
jgi:hypothetical protein